MFRLGGAKHSPPTWLVEQELHRSVLALEEQNAPGLPLAPVCVPTYVVHERFHNCTARPPGLRFEFPLAAMELWYQKHFRHKILFAELKKVA